MASGDTGSTSGGRADTPKAEVKDIDLSNAQGHASTVEYIRNNVVIPPPGSKPEVLQLEVKLPGEQHVSLIMNTENHYILGFKGRDEMVYLLRDEGAEDLKQRLVDNKLVAKKEKVEILKLGGEHPTLGTLDRVFSFKDLGQASKLSEYSSKDSNMTYETIKGPMSLMVCMIAESARVRSMEWAMRDIYFGNGVKANEAIQSWKDACGVLEMSEKYFPKYIRVHAVEKLEKRAQELGPLLDGIKEAHGPVSDEKKFVQDILDGAYTSKEAKTSAQISRVQDMAKELGIKTAAELTSLVTSCKNEVALDAAKDGVVVPRTAPMHPPRRSGAAAGKGR